MQDTLIATEDRMLLSPRGLDYPTFTSASSRMMSTGKSYSIRRAECEADIRQFMLHVGGRAQFAELVAIYHLHYRGKGRKRRPEAVSAFLRSMEDHGVIRCTYNNAGVVIQAEIRSCEVRR